MFESFVIMVREGIEAALVIGIILTVLRKSGRRYLERPVFWGLGLAVLASIGAAALLQFLPLNEEVYEGSLYWASALFVASMMWWMHRTAKTLRTDIEQRIERAVQAAPGRRRNEAWGLGAFAFLMVFREGAETAMFLSAVNLTTDAVLSFIGSLLGLLVAVVFAVMLVRGSLRVNLRRFFLVTEWVLTIFVLQLAVNGYHEFSEAGLLPATQASMAVIGPMVRNNSLFILAIVAIPLFLWISRPAPPAPPASGAPSAAERRLAVAAARRERWYSFGAIATTLVVLAAVGVVYAREAIPKTLPAPELVSSEGGLISIPLAALGDGRLHRFGFVSSGRTIRFVAIKTSDGSVRTGLDACLICGSFGYVQEGAHLRCLNCSAEINPVTIGRAGGCNPIPLESEVTATAVRIRESALEKDARLFAAADDQAAPTAIDPVCGMRVTMSEAAAFEVAGGKTYYFCSERCHRKYLGRR